MQGGDVKSWALTPLDDPAGGVKRREVAITLKNRIVHLPNHPSIERSESQQTKHSRPERERVDLAGISLSRKGDVAHFGTRGAILYCLVIRHGMIHPRDLPARNPTHFH